MHKALYGAVGIFRAYCKSCKTHAFVIDKKIQCCDAHFEMPEEARPRRMTQTGEVKRKKINLSEKKAILERQNNKCIYCGQDLTGFRWSSSKNKYIENKPHYDHFVPWAYEQSTLASNMVASCQPCNNIKSDKVFNTLEEAKVFIETHKKAIITAHPSHKIIADKEAF